MRMLILIGAIASVLSLVGCASTSNLQPGNPLPGIGLGASQDTILLSWTEDGPLANQLRANTQLSVLASYETEYGPVTNEKVASAQVRSGFPGVKFKLDDSLQFPASGPVCLRLAIGRRPIPVRIPTYSESSDGFHYREWAHKATILSEKSALEVQLSTISRNVENFSHPDKKFLTWRADNKLSSVHDCKEITSVNRQKKPSTALKGQAQIEASKQQCVALYNHKFSGTIFANIDNLTKAASGNQRYLAQAESLRNDLRTYSPGKIYFPGSDLPIGSATVKDARASIADGKISNTTARLIIEAYQACEVEAKTKFETSHKNWTEVTAASTIADRKEPLRKLCRARFGREAERLEKLSELRGVKSGIEQDIQTLSKTSLPQLPDKKLLIPQACPTSN